MTNRMDYVWQGGIYANDVYLRSIVSGAYIALIMMRYVVAVSTCGHSCLSQGPPWPIRRKQSTLTVDLSSGCVRVISTSQICSHGKMGRVL